jgi:hypothetical protein
MYWIPLYFPVNLNFFFETRKNTFFRLNYFNSPSIIRKIFPPPFDCAAQGGRPPPPPPRLFSCYTIQIFSQLFSCMLRLKLPWRTRGPVAVRSSAARLLRLWVRIPPGAWMFVGCECCVLLSGRGLCDGLITRLEESYRLWRVVVCDQETSKMRRLKPATGLWKIQPQWVITPGKQNKH